MELDLAALAGQAASTVVNGMATSGWERAQQAMGELWRRVHPERAETVVAELGEARAEVLAARRDGDAEAERELVLEWQRRLRRLLVANPEMVAELQRMIDGLQPAGREDALRANRVTMTATASGNSHITMSGRDINITKG
ncbi:hypothetical protein ACIOEW_13520 [Streptomyces sp. NPDC087901]|uniref:hypothetical protein n=1 Tax=unclassified Streptomyces TaxID=2593676 RepID=UPI003440BB7A